MTPRGGFADDAPPAVRALDRAARCIDVDIGGAAMRWRCWGSEPATAPLMLIHGGHGCWLHWLRNIEALSAGRTVWAPDLPSFGESETLPGPHDRERQKRMVAALARGIDAALGAHARLDIVAFSYGGLTAGQLAACRGGIDRMVLVGPGGHGGARRPQPDMVDWQTGDEAAREQALRQNLQALMLHAPACIDAQTLWMHAYAAGRARFRGKPFSRSAALQEALARIEAPTLFVWGEHDVTAIPEEAAARLTDARRERSWAVLPGAGHWVQHEQAQAFNALVLSWLQTTPVNPATPPAARRPPAASHERH